MKPSPPKSFWDKYKIFIGAGAVAAFLLGFAIFASNEISKTEEAHELARKSKEARPKAAEEAKAPALPKPATLGVAAPLERSIKWTAYYINVAKKAPEGQGKTLIVEANDGKKYRYTVTSKSFKEGEIEAVAEGIDKHGKRRFGYRISEGVWKELPEGSMGMGNKLNALVPLHHIAADQGKYPYGSMVYLAAADGFKTVDGQTLDGYFWVGDTGGAIIGNHFDLFVGEQFRYLNFTKADYGSHFPTKIYPLPKAPKDLDPKTNAGLAEILRQKNFLKEPGLPADAVLREAVVAYQKSQPRIPAAEYGDPDAATTIWFLVQSALEIKEGDAKTKDLSASGKEKGGSSRTVEPGKIWIKAG